MKKVYTYLREISLIVALLVLATGAGWGQDYTDADGKIHITNPRFPRKAMVRPDCLVNSFIDVVNVFKDESKIGNLVDRNIDNCTETKELANIKLVEPIVQIKDRKHYYPKGTNAGFCIQGTGEGTSILSLNLLKIVFISFYKDGKPVGSKAVDQGTDSGLLGLDILQLEGDKEALTYFEAEAPDEFDEIGLMIGGVNIAVANLSSFKIRYAFVGDAQENVLSEELEGLTSIEEELDIWYGGGIVIPLFAYSQQGNLKDNDKETGVICTTIAQINLGKAGPKVGLSWDGKVFQAGTEVGFEFDAGGLLSLGVASSTSIIVANEGQEEEIFLEKSIMSLGLIGGEKTKVSVISPIDFSEVYLKIDPGLAEVGVGRSFYYAYICEPTKLPEENTSLEVSMDASICNNETTYELRPKDAIWTLENVINKEGTDITESVSNNIQYSKGEDAMLVSGLTENAYYYFKAEKDGKTGTLVLNHGVQSSSGCNESVNQDEYELGTNTYLNGGISILEGIKNPENVIDGDNNTYAENSAGIGIASNKHIIGVKKRNGEISDGEEDKRIGFLVETESKLLNLDALNFFRIQLFYKGEPIEDLNGDYVAKDWNVVSAGLIGSENASKARIGVTIPKEVKFDEFALYSTGVLTIHLSTMRIYSAFVENAVESCDNPLNCDVVYAGDDGLFGDAYINYDRTYLPSGISIGSGMSGLENLLLGEFNPDKYVQYFGTLSALSNLSISVNFGRIMSKTHQVGFVMNKQTYLLNADVISGAIITTYLGGFKQEQFSNWSILDANVIGYGDYTYLMFNPTKEYDEVQLQLPVVVGALESIKIYSAFIRNDADGDGIPDCMDPDSCSGGLSGLNITPENACEGEDVVFSTLPNYQEDSRNYKISISKISVTPNEIVKEETVSIPKGSIYQYPISMEAGQYVLTIEENNVDGAIANSVYFTIHPTRTTWETSETTTTDWNEWTNWSAGSPWTCTDVIIPSDADTYPVLKSGVMNGCRYIHFEPNAEVVNTHRLTYEKAWVELALHPNRYYMVTVPLKDTYSGDWFIPQTEPGQNMKVQYPDTFSVLDAQSLPENRVTPTVYQRVWAFKTYNKFFDAQGNAQEETLAATTHWSAPYNYLATPYDKNEGGYDYNAVSVWVHPLRPDATEEGDLDDLTYTFRFPKEHTLYQYYDEHGTGVNAFESIKREQPGRFIYESKDSTFSFPDTMRFYANSETEDGKKLFLVGNPFMSHLDVLELFEANPHITCIKIGGKYEGKGTVYLSCLRDAGMPTGIMPTPISPMESFFVEQEGDAPYCSIIFTEEMLVPAPKIKLTSSPSEAPNADNTIIINADVLSSTASALIRFSASASDNYREREDAEILIENETPPAVVIFTTAEDRALDIQQRANGGEIPLGMYLPKPEDVTLRIAVPDEYSGWVVEDVETNRRYPLMPGEETEIHVGRLTTNVGRFYLKGQSATGNETITATQPKLYCYREAGSHTLVVRSGSEMMTRCEVYGMDGRLRHIGQFETDEYRFPAQKGVQIVKAYFKDGITSTVKVF